MINVTADIKERCKSDVPFLRKTLLVELEKVRDRLETLTDEGFIKSQGEARMLRSIIKLLE